MKFLGSIVLLLLISKSFEGGIDLWYCFINIILIFLESDVDTIIIGAGIAGLSAAEELVRWIIRFLIKNWLTKYFDCFRNGHSNIMVLESSNRIGGRMWTTESKSKSNSICNSSIISFSNLLIIRWICCWFGG